MIKNLFIICMLSITTIKLAAQNLEKTIVKYPLVIHYNSIGTGVANNKPMIDYIIAFKTKNKIKKIEANKIGPMGREGEYILTFNLKGFSKKQTTAFLNGVKLVAKNNKDLGQIVVEQNEEINKANLGRAIVEAVIY